MNYRKLALHRTVLVNVDTGRAFRGALLQVTRDVLVLGNAEVIEAGQGPIPVPGSVLIERARIEWVQVVN